jgi:hypothetical protein
MAPDLLPDNRGDIDPRDLFLQTAVRAKRKMSAL